MSEIRTLYDFQTFLQTANSLRIDLQWFAAEDEGRTEEPTALRLEKAREEGEVPKSQDLTQAVVMIFVVLALLIYAKFIFQNCLNAITFFFNHCTDSSIESSVFKNAFFSFFAKSVFPILFVAAVAGIFANLIQTRGPVISTKKIEPKFSRIMPQIGRFLTQRLFSPQGIFNVLKTFFKVGIVFLIAFFIIKGEFEKLISLINADLYQGMTFLLHLAFKMLMITAIIFFVFSVADFFVQNYTFREGYKMSKQQVREEIKDTEGNPQIKSMIRQRMNELLSQNVRQNVEAADIVITNPTHYACAVEWRKESDDILMKAKGMNEQAQLIKQIARENDVPIFENKPLARSLYAYVDIGQTVPSEYMNVMSIVFTEVYKMHPESKLGQKVEGMQKRRQ